MEISRMALDVESIRYKELLGKLLETNPRPLNDALIGLLPRKGGVYRIVENGSDGTLYVGQSTNLRSRIYGRHLGGSKRVSTLRRKLLRDGDLADEAAVSEFLARECRVQYLEIEDERERTWFEHFAIALLKPKYND
jgi:excinuclease UvrABC nuclease subunit